MWSTTHVAFNGSRLSSAQGALVHAAAGGVGIVALLYCRWLGANVHATGGQPAKHYTIDSAGARAESSRSAGAFTFGLSQRLRGCRFHVTLNSLSGDFIVTSAALQVEGGFLEEIGKRAVWSKARAQDAAAHICQHTLAVDMDMQTDTKWMLGVLQLLQRRADAGSVTSLPLISYDLIKNAQSAFRLLQRGNNIGKVVLRVPQDVRVTSSAGAMISGGTSGLGLMIARWQADAA